MGNYWGFGRGRWEWWRFIRDCYFRCRTLLTIELWVLEALWRKERGLAESGFALHSHPAL